jgi:GTP-binding protein HflX
MSEPEKGIKAKLSCSLDTIQQIGATGIPVVTALNKIDLIEKDELERKIERLKELAPNPVPISAVHKTNIDSLKQQIIQYLEGFVEASFSVKIDDESMSLVSQLYNRAHVQKVDYEGELVKVVFKAIPLFADRVKGRIEKLGGVFTREVNSKGEGGNVA